MQYGTIYYEVSNVYNDIAQEYGMPAEPSLESPTLLWDKPYVHVYSGFDNQVNKTLTFIAVFENNEGVLPSRSYRQAYDFGVEGGDRTDSFAFLVPGIESKGNFIRVTLEVAAAARAQSAGSQEFANFYSPLGVGTYPEQVQKISLPDLYFELDGFEGGFSSEVDGTHYGVLIPHHNGMRFHGLVVRVNLMRMIDEVWCTNRTRFERWDRDLGQAVTVSHDGRDYDEPVESACITILDLESLHPRAFGFRRGFTADGFGFLAPGAKDIAVRLDLTTRDGFTLANTRIVPMGDVDSAFAGFSGGFPDGFAADNTLWACFNPMRTVYGPVGGYQSQDPADKFLLQPIHSAIIACLDFNIWDMWDATAGNAGELRAGFNMSDIKESIQWMDAGNLLPELRGFSDAVRAGRYAYLAPLASGVHEYSPQLVRIYCGNGKDEFIGDKIRNIRSSGGKLRSMMDVLDLSKANENLQGFSGIFTSGKFVILVPYRNKYEPENGQRGHSFVTRLDMNNFDLAGIDFIDVASTQRAQIPTIADKDLRGFCCGFPTGKYAVLIPFYNAVFSGKMARLQIVGDDMSSDLQELDLVVDAANPDLYKGYRGGFVSMWPGFKDSEG